MCIASSFSKGFLKTNGWTIFNHVINFEFDQLFCHMRPSPFYVITTPHKSVSIIQIGTARPDTAFLRFSEEGGRKYKNTELCMDHMVDLEHFFN